MEKTREFLRQYGMLVVAGMVGIGILIYGLWGVMGSEGARVEIIKAGSRNFTPEEITSLSPGAAKLSGEKLGEIVVDIAGSVEKPGLYKLPSGSRIGDGLVMAGGLGADADREWVSKNLNLAEVVKDGGKIYVPEKGATERETPSQSSGKGVTLSGKININTASLGELDSLTGIGEARAKLILDNRPYSNPADLVSKAKIPQSVYDKIKDSITIY